MIINRIEIKKLYGYLNKKIEFNPDINLLVGINGSGKTSVLNVINWILIPSFKNLCTIEFKSIKIHFSFQDERFLIEAKQSTNEVTIDLFNETSKKDFPQIQADIKVHPKTFLNRGHGREKYFKDYESLGPESHEVETWEFITDKLPNPIVIGLDRTLYTEEGGKVSFMQNELGLIEKRITSSQEENPLERVLRLSMTEYTKYKNLILELSKRLNDKIMLSSFSDTLTNDSLNELLNNPKLKLSQVESLEGKVKKYFEENLIESTSKMKKPQRLRDMAVIDAYFTNLKSILDQAKNEKEDRLNILYVTNLSQFKKLKGLIKEFEEFEKKSDKFYFPISQYLDSVNHFLSDSSKELYFDKASSKLFFKVYDEKKNTIVKKRDIKFLSSGEKQILILFTYIKFNSELGNLFIIDEPELSLHPKWQEGFLEAIKKIMPDNTQLLFATHSPAIVGRNKSYCKILLPY